MVQMRLELPCPYISPEVDVEELRRGAERHTPTDTPSLAW